MRKPHKFKEVPVVTVVGKVVPFKDIESAIKAAKIVKDRFPNVLFLEYGSLDEDVDYYNKCKKLVKDLNLTETFIFKGHKTNNPYEIYNQGDITLLTSISEGHPYTIIESLSCERPVVATDVGGIPEVLEGCGLIVQPKDYEAMAQAIIELLNNRELSEELGKKGREKVKKEFDIEKNLRLYEISYRSLVDPSFAASKTKFVSENIILKNLIKDYRERFNEHR
jgi:glycosyltransferase involved in cell wall biosynthesis